VAAAKAESREEGQPELSEARTVPYRNLRHCAEKVGADNSATGARSRAAYSTDGLITNPLTGSAKISTPVPTCQDHQTTCFGGGGGAIACRHTGDDYSSGAQDHGAVVNPTPPGQAPGNVFASIEANTPNASPGPIARSLFRCLHWSPLR
jgi:hypothetical protein